MSVKKNNFFVRLCYGYVSKYKDTSKMTTQEVIEEFLKRKGVSSPREFFEKRFIGVKVSENNIGTEPITKINEEAINNVKVLNISGYSEKEQLYIAEQHKELLRFARDNNDNNEVVFIFRKGFKDKTIVKGTENDAIITYALDGKGTDIVLMHNHPRNNSFSARDIKTFLTTDIKTMTIVKNNGNIECIVKSSEFNFTKAKIELERAFRQLAKRNKYSDSEIEKAIDKFLMNNKGMVLWIKSK